ncbi:MAG: DNA cytosine methyltransferase [Methanoregula sp.]|nr:DNA cytosine methyltransferase [Methanoregula sp.]
MPKWRDVRDVDRSIIDTIGQPTLISGGFPCQPHSVAGKRQASCDDRDLWPEVRRILCEIKPQWFLGENVPGLRSSESGRFFGGILRDLAEMGYSVGWGSWKAADLGAPHHRERVFIIAYSRHMPGSTEQQCKQDLLSKESPPGSEGQLYPSKLANTQGKREGGISARSRDERKRAANSNGCGQVMAYSDVPDASQYRNNAGMGGIREQDKKTVAHSIGKGSQERQGITGAARSRTTINRHCGWIIEPDLGRVVNGFPGRVDRLKCLGNAVVPQQVYQILKAIADIERGSG